MLANKDAGDEGVCGREWLCLGHQHRGEAGGHWAGCKSQLSVFSNHGQATYLTSSSVVRMIIVPTIQAFCEDLMRMHLNA